MLHQRLAVHGGPRVWPYCPHSRGRLAVKREKGQSAGERGFRGKVLADLATFSNCADAATVQIQVMFGLSPGCCPPSLRVLDVDISLHFAHIRP